MHLSRHLFRISAALLLLCCSLGAAAHAQTAAESHVQVQLIAEESAYQPGRLLWVGVLFHLDSGWHVYWQNPGDSGTPPKIQWTVPHGFHAGALHWPLPMRMGKTPVIDYGYENQLLLMAPVMAPANASGPATIAADVKYVVCREICIPGKAQLSVSVPRSANRVEHFSESRQLFQSTREQFPKPPPTAWRISARSNKNSFELTIRGATPAKSATFFPLDPAVIDNSAPQTLSAADGGFALALEKSELLTKPVLSLRGILDVPGMGAFEIAVPITQSVAR
jgi:DsbC/DsbD-like thiol-disulfide interchange protein